MTKKDDAPPVEPPTGDSPLASGFPDLGRLGALPEEDLADLIAAIRQGADTPAEGLGIEPEALTSIEKIGLGYYRAQLYSQAAKVYGFVLRLDPKRSTAWRGLGACYHADKQYAFAALSYQNAVQHAIYDFISWIFMGECLCHLGMKKEGLLILEAVVEKGAQYGAEPMYLERARAIVAARGGMPPKIVLRNQGLEMARKATEDIAGAEAAATEAGAAPPAAPGEGEQEPLYDPTREITVEDMKRNPLLAKDLQQLVRLYQEGKLTLSQVGGFSADEMDGAYACACNYVQLSDYAHAIQIIGWLMFLDPYQGRNFQLLGIIMQRSGQYEAAEPYYELAQHFAPDDPMTAIYRGEARIMAGDREPGLDFIRQGMAKIADKPELDHLRKRGEALLKQFG